MQDDGDLVRRLQTGDGDALRQVYERHKGRLLLIAGCLLVDAAAAEDVLHDVFVSFAAGARQLRLRGKNLRGYLAVCVANRARDELRKDRRRPALLPEVPDAVADDCSPAVLLIDREATEGLYRALSELPYEQREVVMLHRLGDMTFREVAGQLRIPLKTAQSRYRYGLEKLRSLLSKGART